jgi:molybdenum cofactor cytidylyltransferase
MGCLLKGGGGLYPRLVVGAVLLAAGAAERMGGRPKPLLELAGVPLIRRNLIALSGAGVDDVVVVTGHRAEEVEAAVRDFPLTLVRNRDHAQGQMSSVHAGISALAERIDAFVIALADQPLIAAQDIVDLISAFKKRERGSVVVPYVDGHRGNPVVIDAGNRAAILAGGVRFGCRQWIDAHAEEVVRFETGNRHYLVDVDTPEDLERFRTDYGHELRWPTHVSAMA